MELGNMFREPHSTERLSVLPGSRLMAVAHVQWGPYRMPNVGTKIWLILAGTSHKAG
jgi:hypothetical protein